MLRREGASEWGMANCECRIGAGGREKTCGVAGVAAQIFDFMIVVMRRFFSISDAE